MPFHPSTQVNASSSPYLLWQAERQRQELEAFFTEWLSTANTNINNSTSNSKDDDLAAETRNEYKVQNTEIAVVLVNCTEQDDTKRGSMAMIPKAALLGLQKAFVGTSTSTSDKNDATNPTLHAQQWLGRSRHHNRPTGQDNLHNDHNNNNNNNNNNDNDNDRWKYVYLTEPDTVLQARLAALPALSRELQQGNIVVPHRLQPIPHERNLPIYSYYSLDDALKVLQPHRDQVSPQVHLLHSNDFACCDQGPDHPGNRDDLDCASFWWQCGFGEQDEKRQNLTSSNNHTSPHFRLASYQFMELLEGTRIVSLAGTEHGRQCLPKPRRVDGSSC